jgi:alpha-L-fucosidase 2
MQGLFSESFLPMGDLVIKQSLKGSPTSYYRDLNIRDATATTRFTVNGTEFKREVFTSAPDNILVIRLTAQKPGQLNFDVAAKSQLRYTLIAIGQDQLVIKGKAPSHVDPSYYNPKGQEHILYNEVGGCEGMRFQFNVKALNQDGSINTDAAGIHIKNASEVLLLVSAATSFNGFNKCPDRDGKDENKLAAAFLNDAVRKPYPSLLNTHLKDFHTYFNRVALAIKDTLGDNNKNASLPSDERLLSYSKGVYDPGVETLYFNYGRYLLISCSRPGGPPANLQGIWNKELRAPWSSNYTTNINAQMNYWPAEVTNLSEMHQPLLDFIKNASITGTATAKQFYKLDGWVLHHNSDIWGLTNPVGDVGNGDPKWANWYMGANWLCQHLYEHYRFTQTKFF